MIVAEYETKHNRLTVKGHAGAAPKGEDLICAGVTTLVEALNVALEDLDKRGWLASGEARMEEGEAYFQAYGNEKAKMAVHGAFLSTVSGLRWLEANFPDYIRVNIF